MFLSRAKWQNINKIVLGRIYKDIDNNSIGGEGCYHLSKAKWPQLYQLSLNCNGIRQE